MKFAKDVMTAKPKVLELKDKIEKALDLFFEFGFRTIPIIDGNKRPLGVFTESGMIKIMALKARQPELEHVEDFIHFKEGILKVAPDAVVKDFMVKIISDPNLRVMVCLSDDTLLGIISPKDILRLVSGKELHRIKEDKDKAKDILERKNKLIEKVDVDHLFYQAFRSSPQIQIIMTEFGDLLAANIAFLVVMNFEEKDITQLKLETLFMDDYHEEIYRLLARSKHEGKCDSEEIHFMKNVYTSIPAYLHLEAIKANDGKFIAALIQVNLIEEEEKPNYTDIGRRKNRYKDD